MAVKYNNTQEKILIEIDCDSALEASEEVRFRKLALLDLITISDRERIGKDTIYWALQMIKDLEPTRDQYSKLFENNGIKS